MNGRRLNRQLTSICAWGRACARRSRSNRVGGSWFRKPAMAISLAAILLTGITLFRGDGLRQKNTNMAIGLIEPGTAVGDLQALDKNHDLYSDFDVLDDLEVQQDVTANP